eukprot:CAMPEP_0185768228 /NCGR_PEP_ID=MMETSP1174-20130828/48320_1 /TAXON_ID=35687 /ORGANISM="Dictyocha speculum, Strain CCMP1381" /LENGTH=139 /DNA_ID=CAMNT_0028452819 /DNA_START=39 /DNA_END=458 /DNA_ORIENTATION=+
MGGGNGQKSAKARMENQAKMAKIKSPEERKAAANKAASDGQAYACAICKQSFMCTAKPVQLLTHAGSKHPKEDPLRCFPCIPQMERDIAAAEAKAAAEAAKPKKKAPKKKKASTNDLLLAGLASAPGAKKKAGKNNRTT